MKPEDFDAMVIPGEHGPDKLRLDESLVKFTRRFAASSKPLAAICHGPQLLIEADVVKGRTMTSWPSVRTDLINAGAEWVDPHEPPMPPSIGLDDAKNFATSLLKGQPNRKKIALTAVSDKVR